MKKSKLVLILVIAAIVFAFFKFDLQQYLTLQALKEHQTSIQSYYAENQSLTLGIYMLSYILMAALSLPGATILTLAAGAFFGLGMGVVAVSFASTIGATCAMLVARVFLRESVQKKFGDKLKTINDGIAKEGGFYLFTLRLIPAFPFFVINLGMGLTPIKAWKFFWISQIGMLPGTAVYVNAGTQISKIDSLEGILSPALLGSFVLLGIFPLIAKKIVDVIKARKVYRNYKIPKDTDYNMIVIGAGSGGLVSAYIAAAIKARVLLIEKHKMGGDCLNTGCVPSKAILKSAKIMSYSKRAQELGFKKMEVDYDFADVMDRVQRVIKTIEPHDSVERYTGLGVDCETGEAKIISPFEVEVNGKRFTTKNIVVATGARPFVPPIPGLDKVKYYTSDTIWELREQPKKMVVLGGGPIGSELTQAFHRLGSNVTQIEMGPRILVREDPEVSDTVMKKFKDEGVNLLTSHKAKEVVQEGGKNIIICEHEGKDVRVEFDCLLVAIGRKANVTGFGLEELGVRIAKRGTIDHNELLQTNFPNIYVCGDVAGPFQFTHTASHQAWYACLNALLRPFWSFKVDYRVIPWCTFTDPEVARVGMNETEAKEAGIEHQVTTYGIDDLDRAIADEEAHGFVKVITPPGSDKILGVTIVGDHAGDLIAEYVAAMKHGFGMNKILGTIHIYPTLAEANKFAAGNWKRSQVKEWQMNFLSKFHSWRRGKSQSSPARQVSEPSSG